MKSFSNILSLLAGLLIISCAQQIVNTSRTTYLNREHYTADAIKRGGITVLPVVAGAGMEAYRRPMGDSIVDALKSKKVPVVDWVDAMYAIKDADLVDTYQEVIGDYMDTGIIDPKDLKPIGEALNSPYLLVGKLQKVSEQSSTGYDALVGYHEKLRITVACFCQVWSCELSDVIWEGEASSTSVVDYKTTDRKGYKGFTDVAAKGLVTELLRPSAKR